MLLFSNNTEITLAQPLPGASGDPGYGEIIAVDDGTLGEINAPSRGDAQLFTLSHPSLPGVLEVVKVTAIDWAIFTVVRVYELVGAYGPPSWPAGTKMSARITAKTLGSFLQCSDKGVVRPGVAGSGGIAFGTYPSLGDRRASPTNGSPQSAQDKLFAPEVVGGSVPVDLGEADVWYTNSNYPLAVVAPPVPDGFQYWLDIASDEDYSGTNLTPAFAGDADVTIAYSGHTPDHRAVGFWVPTALPIDITTFFQSNAKLVLTEVGFMARSVSAATVPSISIGTEMDRTAFVNNQALSQITGSGQVHRFPITAGGAMAEALRFSVDTAAAGGSFRGRFYWRGFFLNDYE